MKFKRRLVNGLEVLKDKISRSLAYYLLSDQSFKVRNISRIKNRS